MRLHTGRMHDFLLETTIASSVYFFTVMITFLIVIPVQNILFPEYPSRASLLFLPHGVRVLSAWLMGWRAIPALLPGVIAAFVYVAGWDAFLPSRLVAIVVAVSVAPFTFLALKAVGYNLFPAVGRSPCWICILAVGAITSILISALTNLAFGTSTVEFVAYLIGDMSGLFFGLLALIYLFRFLDRVR